MTDLEERISKLGQMDPANEEYMSVFDEAMKLLYEVPVLYVALSRNSLDKENMRSTPVALNKDGFPAFYVFTTYEAAVRWCEYYGFKDDDIPLVASVTKDEDYSSIFQLGNLMGVKMVMVNEGQDYITVGLAEFLHKNDVDADISVFLTEEEIEAAVNEGKVNLSLPMLDIVRVN